jgi:16S rRNA G966 N2-methylase RsmD
VQEESVSESSSLRRDGKRQPAASGFALRSPPRRNGKQFLRSKLRDSAFRCIEGFPHADDGTILALSDPPDFTACPNPFLADFLAESSTTTPSATDGFAADIRVARHDPYSLAHTYHTKVSPLAIVQYIQHFTRPGDVVLDFFCGSGMTGLAAAGANLACTADRPYLSACQPRRAILMDLSPAATHIAAGHAARFTDAEIDVAAELVAAVRRRERELFAVAHRGHLSRLDAWEGLKSPEKARIWGELEYLVWSEVWTCPGCGGDVVFGDAAYNPGACKVAAAIFCPACHRRMNKRNCRRRLEEYIDPLLREKAKRPVLRLLFAAYRVNGHRYYRRAIAADGGPAVSFDGVPLLAPRPVLRGERYYKDALSEAYGVTHTHQFYTPRNLRALAAMLEEAQHAPPVVAKLLRFLVTSIAVKASKLMNYNADGVGRVLKGTLYASSLVQECNPFWLASIALKDIRRLAGASRHDPRNIMISTQSAAAATLPDASVDYVWIDPPFGKSLMYAELNQLWEWWLGVHTAAEHEAVLDVRSGKDLQTYTELMTRCLAQAYRALKPGRWMTIAFHNSQSAVWNAIQEAVCQAGFVLADVQILDKKLLTYKQSQQGLPRVDLVLSAYKPNQSKVQELFLKTGSVENAWRFVRRRLMRLPTPKNSEQITERTSHLLFDRMVAHHLRRGESVPLSAPEFFEGLRERFAERDGMYFVTRS